MAGHERELDTAADHSYHHFHLVKSKILSDAVLITSRERHVGIRVSALSMDRVEMKRVKLVRVLPHLWVTVKVVDGDTYFRALGECDSFKLLSSQS